MDGFKRIQTGSVEAVQNTAAALSELTLKEDELSETAQVSNTLITDRLHIWYTQLCLCYGINHVYVSVLIMRALQHRAK